MLALEKMFLTGAMALLFLLVPLRPVAAGDHHEFDRAVADLIDQAVAGDVSGLVSSRDRFIALSKHPELAREATYFTAFADWHLGLNRMTEPELAKQDIARGFAGVEKLLSEDPEDGMVMFLKLRLLYWHNQLAPENSAQIWQEWGRTLGRSSALEPEHPLTLLHTGLTTFHGFDPDRDKGLALMEKAVARFPQWTDRDDPHRVFWHALGCAWLGNHYLMMDEPNIEAAEAVLLQALELRPDYVLVRDSLLPSTETRTFCAASELEGRHWIQLTDDDEGDGARATSADGKALAWSYDPVKDMLWFRFELYRLPENGSIGVNLVVDSDGNPDNGMPWWGRNRAFRFDRLVSVWVAPANNGEYAGTVGIGKAEEIPSGRMTGVARNNIAFTADVDAKTITIGFARKELTEADSMRLIAAVGANNGWNDDLPDESALTVTLVSAEGD